MMPDNEELVERVARVLNDHFGTGNPDHWSVYTEAARAAIEAAGLEQLHKEVERLATCARDLAIAAGELVVATDGTFEAERRSVLERMEETTAAIEGRA